MLGRLPPDHATMATGSTTCETPLPVVRAHGHRRVKVAFGVTTLAEPGRAASCRVRKLSTVTPNIPWARMPAGRVHVLRQSMPALMRVISRPSVIKSASALSTFRVE